MRYKNNAIDRLTQLDAVANKIMFQVNRGGTQDQIAETIESLKEQIENLREMISVEPDDFEQQFAPRR